MRVQSIEKAKAALKEANYDGSKVVILQPVDLPLLSKSSLIAADLLRKIGMNVEVQAMDFGTLSIRRASRKPIEEGGWSLVGVSTSRLRPSSTSIDLFLYEQRPIFILGSKKILFLKIFFRTPLFFSYIDWGVRTPLVLQNLGKDQVKEEEEVGKEEENQGVTNIKRPPSIGGV